MQLRIRHSLLGTLALIFLIVIVALGSNGCADKTTGSGPHLTVQLIADQTSIAPGSSFTLGVLFKPDPGWHIYWKNPGDSGLPPRFSWKTSPGITIAPPLWPFPDRIPTGPLTNYGYASGDVLIPFQATLNSSSSGRRALAKVSTEWLVCKEECLPGKAEISLSLPVTEMPGAPSPEMLLFEKTFKNLPTPLDKVSIAIEEQEDHVVVALIPLEGRFLPASASFFPEDPRILSNSGPHTSNRDGDVLTLTLKRDKNNKEPISRLRGVLLAEQGWSSTGTPLSVYLDTNPQKEKDSTTTSSPRETTSSPVISVPNTSFLTAVLFALIGGFILNFMPCVFPVLSIKVLSFIEQSKHNFAKVKLHGILFSLGVIVSFVALAGLMLGLRAGGEELGWGFQLQSPTFVAAMAVIFFALGIFFLTELTIGQTIQTLAGSARLPTSYLGSFLNGALATAVATPCTAPFMSTSVAATLTLPPIESLLIFTALGIGMSAPYMLLAAQPSLLRFLPRPGAWMETFKQLMAFPLFASAVWLVRVFARQMGVDHQSLAPVVALLWGLLAIAFALWLTTRAPHARSAGMRIVVRLAAVSFFGLGGYLALPLHATVPTSPGVSKAEEYLDSFGLRWHTYSEEKVAQLQREGNHVFIDFTAEWCITCQANKVVVFSSKAVRNAIRDKQVALVRGDWTSYNQTITKALARYGRNGVPLNVIIAKDSTTKPIILPPILSTSIVLSELEKLK